MIRTHLLTALVATLLASPAAAVLIDFEHTPGGAIPVDNAQLISPYNIGGTDTVSFFFDNNGNYVVDPGTDRPAIFEAAGTDPQPGFANGTTGNEDEANGGLGGQLGDWFLRQFQPGSPPPAFIVDYNTSTPISALSGEIWDIDGGVPLGTEQWLVEALDGSNTLLTSQLSPLGMDATLDGLPWVFAFSGLPGTFDKLKITFVGSKTSGLGLAFNNFNPTEAPEPSSVVLAALGAIGALVMAIRRRKRA